MYLRTLATLAAAAVGVSAMYCPGGDYRQPQECQATARQIKAASFTSDRSEILADFLESSPLSLDSNCTGTILSAFTFDSELKDAIVVITPFIYGLTCEDAPHILDTTTFESTRLEILQEIAPFLVDSDEISARGPILKTLKFGSSKDKANEILDNTSPISCTWGPVPEKHIVFVVDRSGSMSTSFQDSNGQTWTRLEYVVSELQRVIEDQLPSLEGRLFDVVDFASDIKVWNSQLQPTTTANIADANQYLAKLNPGSATNSLDAIDAAYNIPYVEAIYFLSDGVPTNSMSRDAIVAHAAQRAHETDTVVPMNTIFVGLPYPDDAAAGPFMQKLATATGGAYRSVTSE